MSENVNYMKKLPNNIGVHTALVTRDKHKQYIRLVTNFPKPGIYTEKESLELNFSMDPEMDCIKYITRSLGVPYDKIQFVKLKDFMER